MAEMLKHYEYAIESVTLIPSDGGCFEISVNDKLLFSKLRTGRHIEEGEAIQLVKQYESERQ